MESKKKVVKKTKAKGTNKKAIDFVIGIIDNYIAKKHGDLKKISKQKLYKLRIKYFNQLLKDYQIHQLPKSGLFVLKVIKK